jgi:4-hydroxy-tetrahydrodipicolinate synthase
MNPLYGVFAAALTPLTPTGSLDLDGIPVLLDFLSKRGCHGALFLGTTGEGPSFSPDERQLIFRAAVEWRKDHLDFMLLAGTGTPALEETIAINKTAFSLGMDGVVTLPPYYYRKATDEGLAAWFSEVIQKSVPADGFLLGYHFPAVSGVGLSQDLLSRLKDAFPTRFAGLKDSSGDPDHARLLGARFGTELRVFTGNDRLLTHALEHEAAGCITAPANLISPLLRQVYDAYTSGAPDSGGQARLDLARAVLDRYAPFPASLKPLIQRLYGLPGWPCRPPLITLPEDVIDKAAAELMPILEEKTV